MARSKISVTINGFDELIEQIRKAEGDVDGAIQKAVNAGADVVEQELIAQCNAANVPASITNEITKTVERSGNEYRIKVGWKLGEYNPKNISQGFKALFLNYGTPHRSEHGKIKARGFISKAKKASLKKVKAAQQSALEEITGGLKQ